MTKPLSTRAMKALEILKQGGEFRYMLETNSYTHRTQWQARLMMKTQKVSGFGFAVYYELRPMLKLVNSTSVSQYYQLQDQYR